MCSTETQWQDDFPDGCFVQTMSVLDNADLRNTVASNRKTAVDLPLENSYASPQVLAASMILCQLPQIKQKSSQLEHRLRRQEGRRITQAVLGPQDDFGC